jgi:hypothetical protein
MVTRCDYCLSPVRNANRMGFSFQDYGAIRLFNSKECPVFGIDEFPEPAPKCSMGKGERPTCPYCGAHLILALPPDGKGPRTFQCFDCDQPDPMKTEKATGWLKGELHPPK